MPLRTCTEIPPTFDATSGAAFQSELLVAECSSDHPAGRWAYVLGLHANPSDEPVAGQIAFADLGPSAPTGDVVAWDWRAGTATPMAVPMSGPGTMQLHLAAEKGEDRHISFIPMQKGEYTFYCSVSGHRSAGMEGKLIVE